MTEAIGSDRGAEEEVPMSASSADIARSLREFETFTNLAESFDTPWAARLLALLMFPAGLVSYRWIDGIESFGDTAMIGPIFCLFAAVAFLFAGVRSTGRRKDWSLARNHIQAGEWLPTVFAVENMRYLVAADIKRRVLMVGSQMLPFAQVKHMGWVHHPGDNDNMAAWGYELWTVGGEHFQLNLQSFEYRDRAITRVMTVIEQALEQSQRTGQ